MSLKSLKRRRIHGAIDRARTRAIRLLHRRGTRGGLWRVWAVVFRGSRAHGGTFADTAAFDGDDEHRLGRVVSFCRGPR